MIEEYIAYKARTIAYKANYEIMLPPIKTILGDWTYKKLGEQIARQSLINLPT